VIVGVLCCRWFDRDENNSGQLGSSLSTDAAVIRGAVGDVFGVTFQNLACMAAGEVHDYGHAFLCFACPAAGGLRAAVAIADW
jgi:hypothetical protein